MGTDNKVRDQNLQHNINREAVKLSALSSSKIDKQNILQAKKYLLIILEL